MIKIHPGTMLDYKMTLRQREIFTGHVLGDASITKYGSLKINRSSNDRRYLEWTRKEFSELHPRKLPPNKLQNNYIIEDGARRNIYSSICYLHTLSTNELRQERQIWYPVKNKIVPRNIVLTPLALAIWYLDDGSVYVTSYTISLHTESFVEEDVVFLSDLLAREFSLHFGLVTIKSKTGRRLYFLRMNGKDNMFRFSEIVNVHIIPEMGMSEDRASRVDKTSWQKSDME